MRGVNGVDMQFAPVVLYMRYAVWIGGGGWACGLGVSGIRNIRGRTAITEIVTPIRESMLGGRGTGRSKWQKRDYS